jgi:acetyl-CoA carboxylase carboxyl transferase subunit alpha
MGITASRLKSLGLIDKIVSEPVGGAHRDYRAMAASLKRALAEALRQVDSLSASELVAQRIDKLMSYGRFKEQAA